METPRFALALSTVLASLLATPAEAGVTAVTASPNPAAPNQDVTITVNGTGNCSKLGVTFGDGQSQEFNNVTFPQKVTHKYGNAGSYQIISAGKTGNCPGQATTTLTVKSSVTIGVSPGVLEALCSAVGCTPVLTKAMLFSNFTPGGTIVLGGTGLGYNGKAAQIMLPNGGTRNLQILDWGPTYVGARIPNDISGTPDGQCSFKVQTAAGVWSNSLGGMMFTAARDFVELPMSAFSATSCSSAANDYRCNQIVETGGQFICGDEKIAINGYHDCDWVWFCGDHSDSGTDSYSSKALKNGWVVDSVSAVEISCASGSVTATKSGFATGNATTSGSVSWHVGCQDDGNYFIHVIASGPKGLSWK